MRVQAASVSLCLVLLLPSAGLRAAPEDGGTKNVKDEKWIVVTGQSSGRFVWAAFSLIEMEPDANGPVNLFDVPERLINTLLNNLGVAWFDSQLPFDGDISKELGYPNALIGTLLGNLGVPLATDDVVSCDLPVQAIPSAMLAKGQTIELLHYLMKHLHNAAGDSNFELQANCPLWVLLEPEAAPYYVDKPLMLSLKSKTRTGLSRMVRLSNLVAQNIAQERIKAFAEQGVVAPEPLKENSTPNEIADYWKRFVLSPLFIEFNNVIYDDDLSCLIIDVKNHKYRETVGNVAESYWSGEILQYQ